MSLRKTTAGVGVCLLLLGGMCHGAEATPENNNLAKEVSGPPAGVAADEELSVAAAAAGFTPSLGKDAVISRIKAMFQTSSKPIISTKKFVPQAPYISETRIPGDDVNPERTVIVYRCRFVNADKVADSVETALGDAGTIEVSSTQNTLVLNMLSTKAEAMKQLLLSLDMPLPQVLVETQIVELIFKNGEVRDVRMQYSHKDGKTGNTSIYGYDLKSKDTSSDDSGFNFFPVDSQSSDGTTDRFNLMLKWVENSEDARILAAPNVIADLGTEAKMETGEDLPYTENSVTQSAVTQSIKFKRTGVQLTIKPTIINGDTVQLEIKPQVTIAVRYESFAVPNTTTSSGTSSSSTPVSNRIPVVSVRNIDTRLTAADGEIIMLGGLYSSESSDSTSATPFFSEIPVIGQFFTAKNYTVTDKQLLFFMKIHILESPRMVLTNPEQTASEINETAKVLGDSSTIFPKPNIPEIPKGMRDTAEKNIMKDLEKSSEKQKAAKEADSAPSVPEKASVQE